MFKNNKSKRCSNCGYLVNKHKFINNKFFLDDESLFKIIGKTARIQGCNHCLEELKELLGDQIEQSDFEDRIILTYRPNLIEKTKSAITTIFFPPLKKTKASDSKRSSINEQKQ